MCNMTENLQVYDVQSIYAFSTIGGFTLISIIFHVIYAIVKHFRQTLKPEKN